MDKTARTNTRESGVPTVNTARALEQADFAEVVSKAARKRPVKETAEILKLPPRTVENHRNKRHRPNIATFFAYAMLDPEVRAFALRMLGAHSDSDPRAIELLQSAVKLLESKIE